MYIFPSRVDDELIETLASHPAICPYLDMPIQHVNSRLLKAMNRGHDKDHLIAIISKLRNRIPGLSLRTSLIVGFPGETEEDFEELLAFLREYPFDHIGCFAYSEEAQTRSAKLEGKLDAQTIRNRIKRVMDQQFDYVQRQHQHLIGTSVEVLYEGQGLARSYREAPDVDNVIEIENPEGLQIGAFYSAKITQATDGYDYRARIL
jgi:ribosomal protein S12 methylthiotransferase